MLASKVEFLRSPLSFYESLLRGLSRPAPSATCSSDNGSLVSICSLYLGTSTFKEKALAEALGSAVAQGKSVAIAVDGRRATREKEGRDLIAKLRERGVTVNLITVGGKGNT
jgi:hypothetical protein